VERKRASALAIDRLSAAATLWQNVNAFVPVTHADKKHCDHVD